MSASDRKNTEGLYESIHNFLNNPFNFKLFLEFDDAYISAYKVSRIKGIDKSCFRYRSNNKKNIFHLLFSWEIDRDNLHKIVKREYFTSNDQNENYFAQNKRQHIFVYSELEKKAEEMYKHKPLYSRAELLSVLTQCEKENAPFYFKSLEDFYAAQIKEITELLKTFNQYSDSFTHMFLERDSAGFTPLHYASMNPNHSRLNLILAIIKTLSVEDKQRILFAEDNNKRLFLHYLCGQHGVSREILIDVFGEENIARALTHPDMNDLTPFHIVCAEQKSEQFRSICTLLQNQFPSVMMMQNKQLETPLNYFLRNKHLANQDAEYILSLICPFLNQLLQMKTSSGDTLLTHAIAAKQCAFLKTFQQFADPTILYQALIQENAEGHCAFEVAILKGNSETLRHVMQLFSGYKTAFYSLLTRSIATYAMSELSKSDIDNCIQESIGTEFLTAGPLIAAMGELIHSKDPKNNTDFIKEFINACVYIAQGNALPLPNHNPSIPFFSPKRFPNLENRLNKVTAEIIQWYFADVLPFLNHYLTKPEEKKWVDMILKQYNQKMGCTNAIPLPANVSFIPPPPVLQPIYLSPQELELHQREQRSNRKT